MLFQYICKQKAISEELEHMWEVRAVYGGQASALWTFVQVNWN